MARLTYTQTMDSLMLLMRAGYPVIYIVSREENRVLDNVVRAVRLIQQESPKTLWKWSEGVGREELMLGAPYAWSTPAIPATDPGGTPSVPWLSKPGISAESRWGPRVEETASQFLTSLKDAGATSQSLKNAVAVFFDVHRYLRQGSGIDSALVRPLRNAADALRQYYDNRTTRVNPLTNRADLFYKTVIIVAPSAEGLSSELEGDVVVLDFPLPERDELELVLRGMLARRMAENTPPGNRLRGPLNFDEVKDSFRSVLGDVKAPVGEGEKAELLKNYTARLIELVAGAGRGLTLIDYKLALNGFAVEGQVLSPMQVESMLLRKADMVRKTPALTYYPHVDIELGGLHEIKQWINTWRGAVTSESVRREYGLPAPKGVLLLGVSGGGKSQLAMLIAKVYGVALLRLDIGSLFGSYIGESEQRTREALKLAESLSPVVLWLDEIDKAFSGIGGGVSDGGVASRVFGHFLTWLGEKRDSVFVVATANDFRQLLDKFPEFARKGRFDEIFWVGLPIPAARKEIFKIHLTPLTRKLPGSNEPYFRPAHSEIDVIAGGYNQEHCSDELERLCAVLGSDDWSPFMTGAEIEHVVQMASIIAQQLDHDKRKDKFTVPLLAQVLKVAKDRALYNGPKGADLRAMIQIAQANHWIGALDAPAGNPGVPN